MKPKGEKAMSFREMVEKDVYIRLIEHEMTMVCTIRGLLRRKVTVFPLEPASAATTYENAIPVLKIRSRHTPNGS
jgi:hypothetical protein